MGLIFHHCTHSEIEASFVKSALASNILANQYLGSLGQHPSWKVYNAIDVCEDVGGTPATDATGEYERANPVVRLLIHIADSLKISLSMPLHEYTVMSLCEAVPVIASHCHVLSERKFWCQSIENATLGKSIG